MVQQGVLLNVDIVHKVLRTENVLDSMAMGKKNGDERIEFEFENCCDIDRLI